MLPILWCQSLDQRVHKPSQALSRPVEKANRISRSDTFCAGQFLVREIKKQIALVAVFSAERSALLADFHLMFALRVGEPILRSVLHAAPPKSFDAQGNLETQI